jgi:lysozyme family protein
MALPNAEKLTSQMAMLPDAALKQMAMMHKNDPYVLPLIISEDGRRKQMRQAAQAQMGGMPQPKVADAALAQMGQLPENQGIAQIPTPNMQSMADGGIAGYEDDEEGMATGGMGGMFNFAQQSEPVLRMAGGGMTGYMPGFKNTGAVNAAFEAALEKTLKYEGGYVADDAGKGPSNFGINKSANPDVDVKNLTKEKARELYKKRYWDAIGGDALAAKDPALATIAFDTAVNMGVSKASQLIAQSKGDPSAMLSMRQQHYDNLIKDNPKKFASFEKGWKDRVADLATSVIPSAQAGELPKPAAPDLASQIPGQRSPAPASTYDQQNSYFGRLADTMGIPLQKQRDIANTLNATSGFTSPLNTVNRAVGQASKALEATPEMIAKAEQAKRVAETQRLLPPAKAGLEALDEASQATRAAAEAARRARGVEQDVQAAKAAEQSIDAANMTSKIARTTEEAVAAGPNARALDATKLANASKALAGTQLAEEKVKGLFPEGTRPEVGESVSGNYDKVPPPAEAEPKPSELIAAAKEATPTKERKGFGNDDLLMLGLSLLANKSPNFMTALGEAGIQTLGAKKEREKAETDLEYKDIMSKYYGSLGKKAEADASFIASGEKGRMADRQKAAALIENDLAAFRKTMEGSMAQPGAEAAKRKELTNYYFGLFGIDVPATMASTAGVAIPQGVKVTRG